VTAMADAKRYAAAAQGFRQCIGTFVTAHRLTPAQAIIENHRLLAGRKSQDAAAAQMRAEIEAFNMYGIDCSG
jgi:hypothetical protein